MSVKKPVDPDVRRGVPQIAETLVISKATLERLIKRGEIGPPLINQNRAGVWIGSERTLIEHRVHRARDRYTQLMINLNRAEQEMHAFMRSPEAAEIRRVIAEAAKHQPETVVEDGRLVFVYSDGRREDAGPAKGATITTTRRYR